VIVVITEEAEADLEQIGDAIAVDSPERALSFVRELRGRCEGLAEFPKAYPPVPRYEDWHSANKFDWGGLAREMLRNTVTWLDR
jgi:plasmid stabilization system protein ParE